MRQFFSRLTPYSPVTAALGLLSFVGAGLVRFFLPKLSTSVLGLLVLGGGLLLISALGAGRQIIVVLAGRRGRYGGNTLVAVLVFLGILILANFFGAVSPRRYDVTASGQFTLAPQTQRVLRELEAPVKATGFFPATAAHQAARRAAENLLAEYRYHSTMFDYRFVDPETNPGVARQYGVKEYGTIVFEREGRRKAVRLTDEQVFASPEQFFTGAVLEVAGVRQKEVCFLVGHGERNPSSTGRDGYSLAGVGLVRDLYRVNTFDLTVRSDIPESCTVVVMAGPATAFREAEREAIDAYLLQSGKLLALVDPNPPPQVEEILADWGVAVGRGKIIDEGAFVSPDTATPAVVQSAYAPVVITRDLDSTYFPDATAVGPAEGFGGEEGEKERGKWPLDSVSQGSVAMLPLAATSQLSWLETNPLESRFDAGADVKGPLAVGCMVVANGPLGREHSAPAGESDKLTRLVVIGDSDFAANEHFRNGGNSDLFLNAVNWLAEEEHLISIRPKPFAIRRLLVGKGALRFIRYSSAGLLPLAVLVVGGVVWWRRR